MSSNVYWQRFQETGHLIDQQLQEINASFKGAENSSQNQGDLEQFRLQAQLIEQMILTNAAFVKKYVEVQTLNVEGQVHTLKELIGVNEYLKSHQFDNLQKGMECLQKENKRLRKVNKQLQDVIFTSQGDYNNIVQRQEQLVQQTTSFSQKIVIQNLNHPSKKTQGLRIQLRAPVNKFTGRIHLLEELERRCIHSSEAPLILLHGPGGIGKTALAVQFANLHKDKFSLIWHFNCETEALLERGYRELAVVLNLYCIDESRQEVIQKVNARLEREEKRYLLIYDQVSCSIALPEQQGAIIATSQKTHHWPEREEVIPIPSLNLQETKELFSRACSEDEVKALQVELEGSPVLIHVAKQHMENYHLTVADYLNFIKKAIIPHPVWEKQESMHYPKSLAQVYQMALEKLEEDFPSAYHMLVICSFFNSDEISLSLLNFWMDRHNHFADRTIIPLERRAFFQFDEQRNCFSIQRSLLQVIRRNEKNIPALQDAIFLLDEYMQRFSINILSSYSIGKEVVPHVEYILKYLECEPKEVEIVTRLLVKTGLWWQHVKREFHQALNNYYLSLELRKKIVGEHHLSVAESFHHIGTCLVEQGHYEEALEPLRKSKKIRLEAKPQDPALIADSLNWLGNSYSGMGKIEDAEAMHEQALKMRKDHFGETHLDVAKSLCNLGGCSYHFGRIENAIKLTKDALVIELKQLGEHHPFVARDLCNISMYESVLGRHAEAIEIQNKSLTIYRTLFGKYSFEVMRGFYTLGEFAFKEKKFHEVLKRDGKSLKIARVVFDYPHEWIACNHERLGDAHAQLHQWKDAFYHHKESFLARARLEKRSRNSSAKHMQHMSHLLNSMDLKMKVMEKDSSVKAMVKELQEAAVGIIEYPHPGIQMIKRMSDAVGHLPEKVAQDPSSKVPSPVKFNVDEYSSGSPQVINGPFGIPNIGNTCYLNSILQILLNTLCIRQKIREKKDQNDILKALYLFTEIQGKKQASPYLAENLLETIFKVRGKGILQGSQTGQHDAHELLMILLGELNFDVPLQSFYRFHSRDKDHIQAIGSPDNACPLSIAIHEGQNFEENIKSYFREEAMNGEFIYPIIDGKQTPVNQFYKSFKIQGEPPPFLIIHLKRFEIQKDRTTKKVETSLEYPEDGIVYLKEVFENGENTDYRITAHANHNGSLEEGHYNADCLNYRDPSHQKRWIHCNDVDVREHEIRNIKQGAYIILLERI